MADEAQEIIKVKGIEIKLRRATIDCSDLFETKDEDDETQGETTVKKIYKLKHDRSRIVDLAPLESLRLEELEYLLPRKVFVRDCMQEVFNYLVTTPDKMHTVVIGSPGVGKALLSFLAAIQMALIKEDKPVLFMRKTKNNNETISVFLMTKSKTEGNSVDVYFDRKVPKLESCTLCDIYLEIIVGKIAKPDWWVWSRDNLRTFVDGPNYKEKTDRPHRSSLVTSGGHRTFRQKEEGSIQLMALSAWSIEEMRDGMKALHRVPEEIVDIIYDTVGGSYRAAFDAVNIIIQNGQNQLHDVDWDDINVDSEIVRKVIKSKQRQLDNKIQRVKTARDEIRASVSDTRLDSGESIDSLRSMYATLTYDDFEVFSTVTQFLASAYVVRQLRSDISLESLREALEHARTVHRGACYGWHFEHFGHMIFHRLSDALKKNENRQNPVHVPQTVNPFEVVEGEVSKLDQVNLYWTPGIPNFPNIDAAIARDKVLYCLQYTISSDGHKFNYSTFVSKFWDGLQENFKSQIETIKVVFVLPEKHDSNKNDSKGQENSNKQKSYEVSLEGKETRHKFFRIGEGVALKLNASQTESKPAAKRQKRNPCELIEPPANPIERIELTIDFLSEKYELNNPPLPFMEKKDAGQ